MCNCLCNPSLAPISSCTSDLHLCHCAHDDTRPVTAGKATISVGEYTITHRGDCSLTVKHNWAPSKTKTMSQNAIFSFTAWLEDWQMPWCCPALWFYEDFFFSLKWSTWTISVKLLFKAQARFTPVECTPSSTFPQGSFCLSFTFWHLPPKLSPAILNLSRGVFPCPCMASILWPLHIW